MIIYGILIVGLVFPAKNIFLRCYVLEKSWACKYLFFLSNHNENYFCQELLLETCYELLFPSSFIISYNNMLVVVQQHFYNDRTFLLFYAHALCVVNVCMHIIYTYSACVLCAWMYVYVCLYVCKHLKYDTLIQLERKVAPTLLQRLKQTAFNQALQHDERELLIH